MSLRGLKDAHWPMWLAGASYWLAGAPMCVLLGFGLHMQGFGIWLGLAFGLFVAIPAVMAFNYFTGRVESFDVEMDNSSSELVDYFIKQSHKR